MFDFDELEVLEAHQPPESLASACKVAEVQASTDISGESEDRPHTVASRRAELEASLWKAVAATETAGIAVRKDDGCGPGSFIGRLPLGSVVEELELRGGYLRFVVCEGSSLRGPTEGWAQVCAGGRELLRRIKGEGVTDELRMPNRPSTPQRLGALIFLDWDDSLFPTSWFERTFEGGDAHSALPAQAGSRRPRPREALGEHARVVRELISQAKSLGRVFVVTLADRPWVSDSAREHLPEAADVVAQLDVRYARELAPSGKVGAPPVGGVGFGQTSSWTGLKKRAMQAIVEEQLRQHGTAAMWESLVSIGDSEIEKLAVKDLGSELVARGSVRYVKTVKLAEDPAPARLTTQSRELCRRLREIVEHQGSRHYSAAYFMPPRF